VLKKGPAAAVTNLDATPTNPRSISRTDPALLGVALGCVSAVCYTLTNMALRDAADRHDFGWVMWVTGMKAFPVTVAAWAIIAWRMRQGLPALPPRKFVLPLIATGIVMQFLGNVLFQLSLSYGGLALTVALTFSTLIISGAVLGRAWLGEAITPRTLAAMVLLITAVAVLSRGADQASNAVMRERSLGNVVLAVLTGCGSGLGFGLSGVVIRRVLHDRTSLSGSLVFLCTTGVVLPGLLGVATLGPGAIAAIPAKLQWTLFAGGVANAIAFYAVAGALRCLSVVRVNLINSLQVALAGFAGVVFFAEPVTVWLVGGAGLTIGGLVLLGVREDAAAGAAVPDASPAVVTSPEAEAVR
jgi:drug/metabolite transporter (DMT)-like permease